MDPFQRLAKQRKAHPKAETGRLMTDHEDDLSSGSHPRKVGLSD